MPKTHDEPLDPRQRAGASWASARLGDSGGFSVNAQGRQPDPESYMVSRPTGEQEYRTADALQIQQFARSNSDEIEGQPATFIGGWRDEESAEPRDVLDVSDSYPEEGSAAVAGWAGNQDAVYRNPDAQGQGGQVQYAREYPEMLMRAMHRGGHG